MRVLIALCVIGVILTANVAFAGLVNVTGNPGTDGLTLYGNSLQNGVYVGGNANYGYTAYGAGFAIQSGSNLAQGDWRVGDNVLAVGGTFTGITASEAGWSSFTGGGVNALLSSVSSGPKLQAKFGNSAAAWTTSTMAPGSGNGVGSLSYGDGDMTNGAAIQIRTGTYYDAAYWSSHAGTLLALAKDSHVESTASSSVLALDSDVARIMWTVNGAGKVDSWELFLNVSLIARENPAYTGLLPAIGNAAIMTVQNNDAAYTNALVAAAPVPLPPAALLFAPGLAGLIGIRRRLKK